jgi:peptidoglycan-associated lipoprotein
MEHYMARGLFALALLLVVAACSNTPTKDEAPGNVEPSAPSLQRPAETTTTSPTRASPVAEAPNPLKDPGNILSKRSFYFDYDQFLIKDPDRPLLQAHASYLRQHPTAKVVVQGNTDERGTREYNIALGQRRSDAVKQILSLLGADDRQIEAVSFGKEKPRCTASDESCWSQNRRADLVYSGD